MWGTQWSTWIDNYSDGNLVASLIAQKLGITQVRCAPFSFLFQLFLPSVECKNKYNCCLLTVQHCTHFGENKISGLWYLLERVRREISFLMPIYCGYYSHESCWLHSNKHLSRDCWKVGKKGLCFLDPFRRSERESSSTCFLKIWKSLMSDNVFWAVKTLLANTRVIWLSLYQDAIVWLMALMFSIQSSI